MNGSCHCGAVTVRVPGRPDYLNECNCTLCTKLGPLWAYYPRSKVEIDGETRAYVRANVDAPRLSANFCPACGSTTHWAPLAADAPDRMGINMRLFDQAQLRGIEIRYGDFLNHPKAEPRRYYRETGVFDGAGAVA